MKKITLALLTFCSFTFFGQVKLSSSIDEYFDGTNWINSSKYVYQYDTNNNLTDELYYYWNTVTGLWEYNSKETMEYNNDHKITSELYEEYDVSTGNVTSGYKTNYIYNGSNQRIESIDLKLNNGVWVNEYKSSYSYNNNKISEFISQFWNGTNWIYQAESVQQDVSNKTNITYGANGLVSELINYDWNGTSWVLKSKDVYAYNGNNKITQYVSQDWNGSAYENSYKEEYSYDVNGNLILDKESSYDNGSFDVNYETSYSFDFSQLMRNFTHPFKDRYGFEALTGQDNSFVNKLISSSSGLNYKTTYYYGEETAGSKDIRFIDFAIYPNPTSSILKIDDRNFTLKNVEIFNVLEKKVFRSTKNELNIAHLVNGVYLLKIETEKGNVVTKRIIKN
ncbi:T9SS type A sorting domain-containing protein [Polaribacter atrinae]|uniref:Secretion system C-terminal sorting domain-containing protein n=1 Tax=Polaribacter atrinae TaxID=1333662 RepID=A0A176TFA6_9FLAO|nr:T9SS type A sorting domain-containing protein [Polaribacter atrinae]OAD46085.1 hypothetical protein LPB303_04010 [Polaribacter atrinae]